MRKLKCAVSVNGRKVVGDEIMQEIVARSQPLIAAGASAPIARMRAGEELRQEWRISKDDWPETMICQAFGEAVLSDAEHRANTQQQDVE